MVAYLKNLLPRIENFSKTIDQIELFVEEPWIHIDENNNRYQYIFQRNGSLIISINGKVTIGDWEYISTAKSLLVDNKKEKLLLKHAFFNDAILVLKQDSNFETPWIFNHTQQLFAN